MDNIYYWTVMLSKNFWEVTSMGGGGGFLTPRHWGSKSLFVSVFWTLWALRAIWAIWAKQASPGQRKIASFLNCWKLLKVSDAMNWHYCIMLFTSLNLFWNMETIVWLGCIMLWMSLNLFWNMEAIIWLDCIMVWTWFEKIEKIPSSGFGFVLNLVYLLFSPLQKY